MRPILLTIFIFCGSMIGFSQNLVPNPDFEVYTVCPPGNSGISNGWVPSWSQPPGGITTPDYFHACANPGVNCGDVNVPDNFAGYSYAYSGDAYAGIITYYTACPNCREYVQANLTSPLIAGQTYSVEFYVRLGSRSEYATDRLGAYISTGAINQPVNQPILVTPHVEFPSVITDSANWTLVSGTYAAVGGEDYITIGNFYDNAFTTVQVVSFGGSACALASVGAMYYIDNVIVQNITLTLQVTGDTIICEGDSSLLIATGDTAYAWATSINPTNIFSNNDSVVVWPTSTTTYIVYGTSDTDSITIVVNPIPIVNLGNDTTLCPNQTLTLNAFNAGATYLWSTGDVTSSIIVSAAGTYNVTVDIGGCTATDTINVGYYNLINVFLGNDTTLCSANLLLLDAGNPGAQYLWSTGETTQTIVAASAGSYAVQVGPAACPVYDTIVVNYFNSIPVNLGNDTTFCAGGSVVLDAQNPGSTYSWSTGAVTQTIFVNTSGTYWVQADWNGCVGNDTINVTVYPNPVPDLGADTTVCPGQSITLDSDVFSSYVWQDGSTNQTYNALTAGSFSVTVTDGNGCTGSDVMNFTFFGLPVLDLGNDTSICEGEIATFNANFGFVSYLWQDGTTNQSYSANNVGSFFVTATDLNGCTQSDSVSLISLYPDPPTGFLNDTTTCPFDPVILSAPNGYASYFWNDQTYSQQFTVSGEGIYWVEVISSDGCWSIDSTTVTLNCSPTIFTPNAFTPNSDGYNDLFLTIGYNISGFSIKIFNRWGEIVFQGNNIDDGWDGKYLGVDCEIGTYVYLINYSGYDEGTLKSGILTGNVTLIR